MFENFHPENSEHQNENFEEIEAGLIENSNPGDASAYGHHNLETISVDKLPDSEIQSVADFDSQEHYDNLSRDMEMLQQMNGCLEQPGSNIYHEQVFDQWDKELNLGNYSSELGVRGYYDVYSAYFKGDAIAIEQRPDGTLDVLNGRHRIMLAKDMGIDNLPVKVNGTPLRNV